MAKKDGGWGIILLLLFATLGYFVYGGLDGTFGIVLLYILYTIAIYCSLIPFIGIFVQYFVSTEIIFPAVSSFTGIEATWLTTVVIIPTMIAGLIFCIWSSFFFYGFIDELRHNRFYRKKRKEESEQRGW